MQNNNQLTVQELRREAHKFFGSLKSELMSVEEDLDMLDSELATLDKMQTNLSHDIGIIENETITHIYGQLIGLLNRADEDAEYEMGMG